MIDASIDGRKRIGTRIENRLGQIALVRSRPRVSGDYHNNTHKSLQEMIPNAGRHAGACLSAYCPIPLVSYSFVAIAHLTTYARYSSKQRMLADTHMYTYLTTEL